MRALDMTHPSSVRRPVRRFMISSCLVFDRGRQTTMSESATSANYIALAAEIVSAYVSNNAVRPGELPALISDIHSALVRVAGSAAEAPAEALKPAIQAKKSIQPDYLVCLEDGKRFKSLK